MLFLFVLEVRFEDVPVAFRQGVLVGASFRVAVPVDPFPERRECGDAHCQSGGDTQGLVDVHRREADAHEGIYQSGDNGPQALRFCAEDDRLPVVVPSQDETVDDERDGAGHPPSDKVVDGLMEERAAVWPDPEPVRGGEGVGRKVEGRQDAAADERAGDDAPGAPVGGDGRIVQNEVGDVPGDVEAHDPEHRDFKGDDVQLRAHHRREVVETEDEAGVDADLFEDPGDHIPEAEELRRVFPPEQVARVGDHDGQSQGDERQDDVRQDLFHRGHHVIR